MSMHGPMRTSNDMDQVPPKEEALVLDNNDDADFGRLDVIATHRERERERQRESEIIGRIA